MAAPWLAGVVLISNSNDAHSSRIVRAGAQSRLTYSLAGVALSVRHRCFRFTLNLTSSS